MAVLRMPFTDPEIIHFAEHGLALPAGGAVATTAHDGAVLWHAAFGPPDGLPVMLLHGGLGHSGNFGHQVPALAAAGYRVLVMDSRGHGRSTRDGATFSYARMAGDLAAVLAARDIDRAALVGWSDGACIALEHARRAPETVAGVFFFACNVDPSGTKPLDEDNPLPGRCFGRHRADYAALNPEPGNFVAFAEALGVMQQSEPNYGAADLADVRVPVTVALGEQDEFIRREHAEYLAASIPGAQFLLLPGVSHFAPLQDPALFNRAVLDFLDRHA
jgi:non-heme chloroperoxidase